MLLAGLRRECVDPALGSAVLQLRYELPTVWFRQLGIWEISSRVTDIYCRDGCEVHANRAETSLLLHAAPNMVRQELAFDVTVNRFWSYDMPHTTRIGVVGRPSESSAEDGAAMAAIVVDEFEVLLRAEMAENWPELPSAPRDRTPA